MSLELLFVNGKITENLGVTKRAKTTDHLSTPLLCWTRIFRQGWILSPALGFFEVSPVLLFGWKPCQYDPSLPNLDPTCRVMISTKHIHAIDCHDATYNDCFNAFDEAQVAVT